MLLKRTQQKIMHRADNIQIAEKLQAEFDSLVANMNEYYAVKKQLLESKRDDVVRSMSTHCLKYVTNKSSSILNSRSVIGPKQ